MIELHYQATGLGEIDCDACGNVICFGFVDFADDCGFLCRACQKKIAHSEIKTIELEQFERICSNLDYMFCPGHEWDDITYCTLSFGGTTYQCKHCEATKCEPVDFCNPVMFKMIEVPKLEVRMPEQD